jgi:hypothetical protein
MRTAAADGIRAAGFAPPALFDQVQEGSVVIVRSTLAKLRDGQNAGGAMQPPSSTQPSPVGQHDSDERDEKSPDRQAMQAAGDLSHTQGEVASALLIPPPNTPEKKHKKELWAAFVQQQSEHDFRFPDLRDFDLRPI